MASLLLYLAAALTTAWGVAHLLPTQKVVASFGPISLDNQRIITMEWIVEGVTLVFIGVLIGTVTFVGPDGVLSKAVLTTVVLILVALSLVSLFTGFKVKFLPYRLCPVVLLTSAILVFLGGIL
jgi:hypothetical protein